MLRSLWTNFAMTRSILTALLCSAMPVAAMDRVTEPVRHPSGFVGYVRPAALEERPLDRWRGAYAKTLSEDPRTGRLAVLARFPGGWWRAASRSAAGAPAPQAQSIEIVMLEGELIFGAERLRKYDFAFVPPGIAPPVMASSRVADARALLFFDPPSPDPSAVARQRERGAYVTRFDPARWQPASLAKSAGATADLKVMHLKRDPFTTARTWYVRLEGGMKVPWEVHSMVEEGVLMDGRYALAECFPDRTVIGEYLSEDYFWRPGGVPHSGPASGPPPGSPAAIWLQRSPIALDVVFYAGCNAGRAEGAVR